MANMIKKMAAKPMKKAMNGSTMSGPKKKIKPAPKFNNSKLDEYGMYPINSKEEKARRGGDEVDFDALYENATGIGPNSRIKSKAKVAPKKKMGGKVMKKK